MALLICLLVPPIILVSSEVEADDERKIVNLEIIKVKYKPSIFRVGEDITIELIVVSAGNLTLFDVVVTAMANSEMIGEVTFDILPAQTDKLAIFFWRIQRNGDYRMRYTIDKCNKIAEVNEEDNELTDEILVRSYGPDFMEPPLFECLVLERLFFLMVFFIYLLGRSPKRINQGRTLHL